jgi:hypothetical protein
MSPDTDKPMAQAKKFYSDPIIGNYDILAFKRFDWKEYGLRNRFNEYF